MGYYVCYGISQLPCPRLKGKHGPACYRSAFMSKSDFSVAFILMYNLDLENDFSIVYTKVNPGR